MMADRGVRQRLAAAGGLLAIVVALSPPFDALSDRFLTDHMVQHLLLIDVGAPLLVLGRPDQALGRLLGRGWLVRCGKEHPAPHRSRLATRGTDVLAHPIAGWVLANAVLWLWHIPVAYNLALEHDGVHALEHLTFVLAFLLFWWPLLAPPASPGALRTNGGRALYLLAGATSIGLLGALITFAPAVLYPHYAAILGPGPAFADQQRAGAVMWLGGPLIYLIAAAFVLRDDG